MSIILIGSVTLLSIVTGSISAVLGYRAELKDELQVERKMTENSSKETFIKEKQALPVKSKEPKRQKSTHKKNLSSALPSPIKKFEKYKSVDSDAAYEALVKVYHERYKLGSMKSRRSPHDRRFFY